MSVYETVKPDRALATVRMVSRVTPIPNAERIELATVDGWNVIVGKKDNLKPGDKIVYFEIDSVFPDDAEWCSKHVQCHGTRIKTIKMLGVYSQGLIMTLEECGIDQSTPVGTDLTDKLHIMKYVTPEEKIWIPVKGKPCKPFPNWIRKTDEPRVENVWRNLQKNLDYIVTEKIDGTSMTYGIRKKKTPWYKKLTNYLKYGTTKSFEDVVCSRNCDVTDQDNIYTRAACKFKLGVICRDLFAEYDAKESLVIQGELFVPEFSSHYSDKIEYHSDFYVFNVYVDGVRRCMLDWETDVKRLGLKTVPVIDACFSLPDSVDELKWWNEQMTSMAYPGCTHEGVVIRDYVGFNSCKCINRNYLIKEK